jgi:hypothetical protein
MAGSRSRSSGPSSGRRTAPSRSRSGAVRDSEPPQAVDDGANSGRGVTGTALRAAGKAGKFAVKNVGVPVASAAVGAVAATALEQRRANRRRKVLGVPLPRVRGVEFDGLAKSIGEAGKQFGRLADEVRQSREKAEQVGKALS